jgi:gas vesicle protein
MKFTFGLLAGIAVGAALTHYLTSKEGGALIDKIKEDIDDIGEKISELVENLVAKGKSTAETETASSPVIVEENIVFIVPEEKEARVPVPDNF